MVFEKPPVLQVQVPLPAGFTPTCMAHPDTYLNKLVVGSAGGQLLLLNFMTGVCRGCGWTGQEGLWVSSCGIRFQGL